MTDTTDPQAALYRHRTTEIEAVQWTGSNADQLRAFCGPDFDTIDPEDRAEDPDQDAQLLSDASHWVGLKPGDWVLKFADCFTATSDEAFQTGWEPVSSAVAAPATGQAALRERIADILAAADGWTWAEGFDKTKSPAYRGYQSRADAVLAVLPATVDRADVYAEVADRLAKDAETGDKEGLTRIYRRSAAKQVREWGDELRRLADETPADTQAADRVVAYRSPGTRTLYCVTCARQETGWQPLTLAELPGGASCDFCGGSVLAIASQTLGAVVASYMPDAVVQAAAPHTDEEAHEPFHCWRVEILDGDTWTGDSRGFGARSLAVDRYQAASQNAPAWADGQPVQRRIVRETTSYTVEPAAGLPAGGAPQDGDRP
jgi:hypothetical protein